MEKIIREETGSLKLHKRPAMLVSSLAYPTGNKTFYTDNKKATTYKASGREDVLTSERVKSFYL